MVKGWIKFILFMTAYILSLCFALNLVWGSLIFDGGTGGSARETAPGKVEVISSSGSVWAQSFDPAWAYENIEGDFSIIARMEIGQSFNAQYEKAGLLFREDDDNYVQIGLQYDGNQQEIKTASFNNDVASVASDQSYSANVVYFRIVRVGSTIETSYSADPTNDGWTVRQSAVPFSYSGPGQVGMFATHFPDGARYTVNFEYAIDDTEPPPPPPPPVPVDETLTFGWDLHPEADTVDGYRLYMSETSGGHVFGAGNALAVQTGGQSTRIGPLELSLIPEKSYYFVLTAYNEHGESGPSKELEFIAPPGEDLPPAGVITVTVTAQ